MVIAQHLKIGNFHLLVHVGATFSLHVQNFTIHTTELMELLISFCVPFNTPPEEKMVLK
jgi:hypothetical protein